MGRIVKPPVRSPEVLATVTRILNADGLLLYSRTTRWLRSLLFGVMALRTFFVFLVSRAIVCGQRPLPCPRFSDSFLGSILGSPSCLSYSFLALYRGSLAPTARIVQAKP